MTKASVKKTLGVIGSLDIFIIASYGAFKDPTQIPNILWPLMAFIALLFGIKKYVPNRPEENKEV